jgi:hypothetical protein
MSEIEHMVHELYGTNLPDGSTGSIILNDVTKFAETRGGALTLSSYTIYAANHSLLLLPAFRIQRKIQSKVLGIHYWKKIERSRAEENRNKGQVVFDARQAHFLLREFKEGGVDAMLRCWRGPKEALTRLHHNNERGHKNSKIKQDAGNKVRRNLEQNTKLKGSVPRVCETSNNVTDTTVVISPLLDETEKLQRSISITKSSHDTNILNSATKAHVKYCFPNKISGSRLIRNGVLRERKVQGRTKRKEQVQARAPDRQEGTSPDTPNQIVHRRHKDRRSRPTTAPASLSETGMLKQRSKTFDHRSKLSRPRTPGLIINSIHQEGGNYQFLDGNF